MKRTVLFLTFTAFIGLNVSTPTQAIYNPIASLNLNPLKGCNLIPQIDKAKLGMYIIGGSLVFAAGTDVCALLYSKVKSVCQFCKDNPHWVAAGAGVLTGVYLMGAGSTQNLNAIRVPDFK